MPAAIAIPAIISAAGSVGAAAIQSHQAGKAVKAQTQAGQRANARLDPYATAGYGAISNLQGMVGRPQPAANAAPMGGPSNMAAMARPPQPQMEQNKMGGGMVTVRSPDGSETRQVPASESGYWQSKGGVIV